MRQFSLSADLGLVALIGLFLGGLTQNPVLLAAAIPIAVFGLMILEDRYVPARVSRWLVAIFVTLIVIAVLMLARPVID